MGTEVNRDREYIRRRENGLANGDNKRNNNGPYTQSGSRSTEPEHSTTTTRNLLDMEEQTKLQFIFGFRIFSVVVWSVSVLYATYHVFLACEDYLDWYSDPVMNPGSLSGVLGRGKDVTDYEWEMFSILYLSRLCLWYVIYVIMSRIVPLWWSLEAWNLLSICLSIVMFWELVGFLPTVFILAQPVIYWRIAQTRSKLLAWTTTIFFIYNLNSPIVQIFIPVNSYSEYFFVITSAWNYARCISFCYDVWTDEDCKKNGIGLEKLINVIHYCLYLPLSISGPLVTYESFETHIIYQDIEVLKRRDMTKDFLNLVKKLCRIGCTALLTELVLHTLYFRALSMTTSVHRNLSLWAICGTIYWLGQFFTMKYKVLYGIPTCIAEFDGMTMPPLPRCPSYLHRYSVLWRDFDRGLYTFLVKYIYLPTLAYIQSTDAATKIPLDVQKLIASFMSFVYVYVWHSLSFDVFVWAALNFLGITIERIGSAIKREIDKRKPLDALEWDFVIEPFVTVPLAAMSILNSAIFCGSMEAAKSFTIQLWNRRSENWVFLFLYFFTHTAVYLRSASKKSKSN